MALACAILFCGGDANLEEKPPPSEPSIDGIYEAIENANADYAPFIDEATAKRQSKILALESELDAANAENDRLSDKVDELNQEISELKKAREAEKNVSNTRRDHSIDNGRNNTSSNDTTTQGKVGTSYEATFYTAFCPTGCTGVTATGVDVSNTIYHKGKRVIAVDPSVIPLGSHVKVTLSNGESFEATAQDTGGAIKGKRIDILVASRDEAYRYGRQTVTVEIIK